MRESYFNNNIQKSPLWAQSAFATQLESPFGSWKFFPVWKMQWLALSGISRLAAIRQTQRITENAVVDV